MITITSKADLDQYCSEIKQFPRLAGEEEMRSLATCIVAAQEQRGLSACLSRTNTGKRLPGLKGDQDDEHDGLWTLPLLGAVGRILDQGGKYQSHVTV